MTWNTSDMLRSATNGTFSSYYSYNAAGDRVRKVVEKGNIREERLYLGNYECYRKYVNNILKTERQTVHIIDDRHRFALIDRLAIDNGITLSTASNSIRYQYDNHLGSASLELDQTAAIISYEEYHPFGTTSYRSGRTETEVSQKRYKYVGKERDEETGLYYYGARYYAGWLCRFVSVDPLQFKYPHYTPYQYAGNKPVSYIDLDGLEEAKNEESKPIGEVDFINKYTGKFLGTFSSEANTGYSVRAIDPIDFEYLKNNNFNEYSAPWGEVLSVEASSKLIKLDTVSIQRDLSSIITKTFKTIDSVYQSIEKAAFINLDMENSVISSRLQPQEKNTYKFADHEEVERFGIYTRKKNSQTLIVIAEIHSHENIPIGLRSENKFRFGDNKEGDEYNDKGFSPDDLNFSKAKGISLYAIDKFSNNEDFGSIFGMSKNESREITRKAIMNLQEIIQNPEIFIKDVIRRNK